jgi:FtsP/CotA-like multicopper oxidase with cupredoxin domain
VRRRAAFLLLLALSLATAPACQRRAAEPAPPAAAPRIETHDNRQPAGAQQAETLRLDLEIQEGMWQPEAARAPYRILAMSEAGKPPVVPAPLIRVREGVTIDVSITNRSEAELVVHGLHDRTSPPSELRIAAHGKATARFRPGSTGTYFYWATKKEPLDNRTGDDSQLTGALVVDPREGSPEDRVFVFGHYSTGGPNALDSWVINGRSWPDTERLRYEAGQTVRWRWINGSSSSHPMHLHGQYFRVLRDGDNQRDAPRAADLPEMVVTESLPTGRTMTMEWTAERAGNWLFHCHILFHVIPDNRLPLPQWYTEYAELPHDQHMFGLVLGLTISGGGQSAPREIKEPRRLTLRVGERPGVKFATDGLESPGLGYAIGDGPVTAPGPMLVLQRAQPVEIDVVNQIAHATSVHWHGIELESYYDGVPHWGGDERRRTPYIEPGKSFLAKFTPPRAGTFIYHTHFNEFAQLSSGLYGALIVLEPGQTLDPALDHTFIISRGGVNDGEDPVLVNGAISAAPVALRRGVTHRLRLIGITPVQTATVALVDGDQPVEWRPLAKDGAMLEAGRTSPRAAQIKVAPGETYDFTITPQRAGELRLEVTLKLPNKTVKAEARLPVR